MSTKTQTGASVPISSVEAALDAWWKTELEEVQSVQAPVASEDQSSVLTPLIEIDSLRCVRALIEIEAIVGFDIPESTIREGGYASFEDLKLDLLAKVEKLIAKEKVHG